MSTAQLVPSQSTLSPRPLGPSLKSCKMTGVYCQTRVLYHCDIVRSNG